MKIYCIMDAYTSELCSMAFVNKDAAEAFANNKNIENCKTEEYRSPTRFFVEQIYLVE